MGYTKEVIKGFSWLWGIRIASRALTFVKIIVIGRVLTPSQVGIFGITIIALSLIQIFTETGLDIFLVQQNEQAEKYIDTAWVISTVRGFVIGIIILLGAFPISQFFHAPQAFYLLLLISIVPIIQGFVNPSNSLFLKNLQYNRQFYYSTAVSFSETALSIIFIFLFHSPAALVGGLIGSASFELFISFLIVRPLPHLTYKKELLQKIFHQGKWLTASAIFDYTYHNIDNLVVGKILGTASLGLYDMAYKLASIPITEVSDVLNQTTFPVFVKIWDNTRRLSSAFLKTILFTSVIIIPIGIVFFFFPRTIIQIILGNQWVQADSALRILVLYGMLRALTNIVSAIFFAVNRQDIVAQVTGISVAGLCISVIPFTYKFGIIGTGYAVVFGSILALPFIFFQTNKLFKSL